MISNLAFQATKILSANDWIFIIGIQLFLLLLFIFMVSYFCRQFKKKESPKPTKKTCILIWFMSAIAWFIIAKIVWILTYSQFTGA